MRSEGADSIDETGDGSYRQPNAQPSQQETIRERNRKYSGASAQKEQALQANGPGQNRGGIAAVSRIHGEGRRVDDKPVMKPGNGNTGHCEQGKPNQQKNRNQ